MLNVPTLWTAFVINFFTMGLIWAYVVRSYPKLEAARFWTASAIAAGLGALLAMARVIVDSLLPLVAGGTVLVFAGCLAAMGVFRFYDRRISWRLSFLITGLTCATLIFFIVVHDSVPIRILVYTVGQSVPLALTLKLLLAPHSTPTLAVMAEAGILGTVLGGVPLLASFENTAKAEAAIGAEPNSTRRLGALGVAVIEDAERLSQRLRLSNAEFERLMALEYWWRVRPAAGEHAARVLLYQLGPASFTDRVLVAWSRSAAGAADRGWQELATLPQRWTAPRFPLKAADFLNRGVPKGPEMGAALRAAEQAWIDADFPEDRAAIYAIADRVSIRIRSSTD